MNFPRSAILLFNNNNDAIFIHALPFHNKPAHFLEVNSLACRNP